MNLFEKHPELVGMVIALGWALISYLKERTKRLTSEKALLTVSDAVHAHGDHGLNCAIESHQHQLTAAGDGATARAIEKAAATVDLHRISPDAGMQKVYETLPIGQDTKS